MQPSGGEKNKGAIKPRLMMIDDACAYSGLSRSGLYRHASAKRVTLVKDGSKTLVVTETLDSLIDSLPKAVLR